MSKAKDNYSQKNPITVTRGKNILDKVSDETLRVALAHFVTLKSKEKQLKEELELCHEAIVSFSRKYVDSDGCTVTLECPAGQKIKVAFGTDITINDAETLQGLLGEGWGLLVKQKISFAPEPKLKEIALDNPQIRECLKYKEKRPAISVA